MAIFSSTQPSLRARILPRFPAQVVAGTGITIIKSGGVYTFAMNLSGIPLSALADIGTDRLLGRDTVGSGAPEEIAVSGGLGFTGGGSLELTDNQRLRHVDIQLYNGGAALTTGIKQDYIVPFGFIISKVTLLADQTGSVVVDIWKSDYANFPPLVAGSITAAAKPTLSGTAKSQDSTLTGWTTSIAAGDILRFNIDSVATITRLLLCLEGRTL